MTRSKISLPILVLFFVCLAVLPATAAYEIGYTGLPTSLKSIIGHTEDDVIEVLDEDGKYIFATAVGVSEGDRYISEENNEYKIIKVDGKKATAKFVGKVDLLSGDKSLLGAIGDLPPLAQGGGNKTVALYHTHSAESYSPGPAFKEDRGEVYDVGHFLKQEFEKRGVKTVQSEDTFLPHDGGAYDRSRRTAAELLKQRPDAIFDVHRDAIPRPEEYRTKVDGQQVTQVRLVVGRQNPNMQANEEMAKRLKAIADKKHPGLIKGIFYAKGKYNQELSPRALLLEFGTHVTTKEEAEKSTAALADSIYTMLYGAGGTAAGGEKGTNRAQGNAGWRNLLWVVGAVVVVGIGFLFLNEGGVSGVSSRLKNFGSEEFANFLGRVKRRKKRK